MTRNKALILTNKKPFWQATMQRFFTTLKSNEYRVIKVDTIEAAQNILRQSEENITVFSFCSTESEKNKIMALLGKEKFPIVIIMPYDKHIPDYPLVKCVSIIPTTFQILPKIMEIAVP